MGITNGSVLHVTIGLSTFEVAINWLRITKKFREKIKMINLFYHNEMTSKVHNYLSEILHIYSHAMYELRLHLSLQASRFSDKQSHTPGPGAYNLQKRSDWLRENQPQNALPPDIQVQEGMKDGSVSGRDFVIICHVEKQFLIDTETFMFFL